MTLMEMYMQKEAALRADDAALAFFQKAKKYGDPEAEALAKRIAKGEAQGGLPGLMGKIEQRAKKEGRTVTRKPRLSPDKQGGQDVAGGLWGRADMLSRTHLGVGANTAAGIGGTALLGGGALLARRLGRKSGMQRFTAAMKKNRGKLLAGAGAAGAAGGLAAYLRNRKNSK